MKNFFNALLWFLLLAVLAIIFHYFIGEKMCGVCNADKVKTEQVTTTKKVVQKLAEFMITDTNGNMVFRFPNDFVINSLNEDVEIPQRMMGFKDSIYNYLNANQDRELLITAKYLEPEGEPRGLNRAEFLKSILVRSGINAERIVPKAVMSDYSYDEDTKYDDGIAMLFRNLSDTKAVEQSITNKTLYSDFGQAEFKADRTLEGYAFELKSYLSSNGNKKVSVTGHTDNVGGNSANYNLGLRRAKQVTNYLISQGISKSSIKAYSKGEKEPEASNDTEEGRAQNRRITIRVK